ncbi:DUF883 family protein [Marinobacter sp. X15-166B]|uniref:DUF883 family protein n=1 Tax=Marinobacter sp. X15-166B TaxID=1897620 RepID=UPI0018E989A1|nr:hypothetical protein [Marinobacter sp. X15-166B]
MEAKTTQDDYRRVKEDLQLLKEDLSALTKTVAEGHKNNISSIREEIRRETQEALTKARKRGEEALHKAKDKGDKAIHDMEDTIGERPFLSILIMFLAGVIVGKLLDRQ